MATKIETIGIIGAGIMGRGIAQLAATSGLEVWLFDVDPNSVDDALTFISRMINRAVEKGSMTQAECDLALARLNRADNLQALGNCHLVVEAIVEAIEVKQTLFKQLEEIVAPDTILASNTSSLSISEIASVCERPERVAGYHFFNPVPLMRLVEIISGLRTKQDTIDRLMALTGILGKTSVSVIDSPGFLVNHAGRGFYTEALRVLSEQIAAPAVIDMILRDGAGFRMGPFELMDVTALDVSHPVMEQIYHQFFEEPRYRPQALTRARLAAGLLGRKTGEGFYVYKDGKNVSPPASMPEGDGSKISSVFLVDKDQDASKLLVAELNQLGIEIADTAKHADICITMPFGLDCTTAALGANMPPEKTIAIDPCAGFDGTPIFEKIAVTMTNPATEKTLAENFASLLNSKDRPCVMINDSAGFVCQRVLAQIVNIGADIAQQGIAAPQDIETAVKLGLGYPKGPLSLGDQLGADYCTLILDGLFQFYGDPRYRISPWLKRRARLKMSLMTP